MIAEKLAQSIVIFMVFITAQQLHGSAEPVLKKTTTGLVKQGEMIYRDYISIRDTARRYFQDRRFITSYDTKVRGILTNFCRVGNELRRGSYGPSAFSKNHAIIVCLEQFVEQLLDVKNNFLFEVGVRKQYLWERCSEPQLVLGGTLATVNREISVASVRSPRAEHWVEIEDESGFCQPPKHADKKMDHDIFYLEIRELENNNELYRKNLSLDRHRINCILLPRRALKIAIERYLKRVRTNKEWWQSTLKAAYLFAHEVNLLSRIILKVSGFHTDFRFFDNKNEEIFVDNPKST